MALTVTELRRELCEVRDMLISALTSEIRMLSGESEKQSSLWNCECAVPRLREGSSVTVTDDASTMENECKALGMLWPNCVDGSPRADQLAETGTIVCYELGGNLVKLNLKGRIAWVPLRALKGFEVKNISKRMPPLPVKSSNSLNVQPLATTSPSAAVSPFSSMPISEKVTDAHSPAMASAGNRSSTNRSLCRGDSHIQFDNYTDKISDAHSSGRMAEAVRKSIIKEEVVLPVPGRRSVQRRSLALSASGEVELITDKITEAHSAGRMAAAVRKSMSKDEALLHLPGRKSMFPPEQKPNHKKSMFSPLKTEVMSKEEAIFHLQEHCTKFENGKKYSRLDTVPDSPTEDVEQSPMAQTETGSRPVRKSDSKRRAIRKYSRPDEQLMEEDDAEIMDGCISNFIRSATFRKLSGLMVVSNLVQVGLEVDYRARTPDGILPWFVVFSSNTFCAGFTLELLLRLYVWRLRFFKPGDRQFWNLFDFFVVCLQLSDELSKMFSQTGFMQVWAGTFSRLCRLVRLIRVLRLFRFFQLNEDLRIIVMTISESFRLFVMSMVLLLSLLYIFSVVFTEICTRYRTAGEGLPGNLEDNLNHYYGSLGITMLTLFESIAGGISWDEAIRPTIHTSSLWGWSYCVFVAFSSYAVLNIITSIFVNTSMQYADNVRKEKLLADLMRTMTYALDVNSDGIVDRAEFVKCLGEPSVEEYFRRFNIDINYGQHLFTVLDHSDDGTVEVHEFICAMADLTRPAQALETMLILQEVFHISDLLHRLDPQLSTFYESEAS